MKTFFILAFAVLACFATGFIASRFQLEALASWYPQLHKSPLTPPNWVFPAAWSALYVCMGLSIGLIITSGGADKVFFIKLFAAQLFFNFIWSIAFFYWKSPLGGLAVIAVLAALIVLYAVTAYPAYRVSSLLFLPYIAWVVFAAYLNVYIVLRN